MNTFSYYDQVLDAAVLLGAVPARFARRSPTTWTATSPRPAATTSRAAGDDQVVRHQLPLPGAGDRPGDHVRAATRHGARASWPRPRRTASDPPGHRRPGHLPAAEQGRRRRRPRRSTGCEDLLPVYARAAGAAGRRRRQWVQLDEPALVTDIARPTAARAGRRASTSALAAAADRPAILVATSFGASALRCRPWPRTADRGDRASTWSTAATPASPACPSWPTRPLVGRRRRRPQHLAQRPRRGARQAGRAAGLGGATVAVSTSSSLLHVPYTSTTRPSSTPQLRSWLAFADQKVAEVATLATALHDGRDAGRRRDRRVRRAPSPTARSDPRLHDGAGPRPARPRSPTSGVHRGDYAGAARARSALDLPPLPTTTIGSFPQTGEIRKARAALAKGEIDRGRVRRA